MAYGVLSGEWVNSKLGDLHCMLLFLVSLVSYKSVHNLIISALFSLIHNYFQIILE